jgi:hypothetical protein
VTCWVLLMRVAPTVRAIIAHCFPPLCTNRSQKPASWRLACQTIVGDGENSGKLVISTKPQQ